MTEAVWPVIVGLDLEIHPATGALLAVGAAADGHPPLRLENLRDGPAAALQALAEYVDRVVAAHSLNPADSGFVLGHNLVWHDLPWLRAAAPGHPVLRWPAVDTLLLSPLAFPEHPYHRLWKGYRTTNSSRNDPLRDARAALELFREQCETLRQDPFLALYVQLLGGDERGVGTARALSVCASPTSDRTQMREDVPTGRPGGGSHASSDRHGTGGAGRPQAGSAVDLGNGLVWRAAAGSTTGGGGWDSVRAQVTARACAAALDEILPERGRPSGGLEAAFALAWLRVADGKSRPAP